jgi:aminoglycoside phosphotransferase family enzyme
VVMRRLDDNDTLQSAVTSGSIRLSVIESLARRIQHFHENECERVNLPAAEIRRNVIQNFEQTKTDMEKGEYVVVLSFLMLAHLLSCCCC